MGVRIAEDALTKNQSTALQTEIRAQAETLWWEGTLGILGSPKWLVWQEPESKREPIGGQ